MRKIGTPVLMPFNGASVPGLITKNKSVTSNAGTGSEETTYEYDLVLFLPNGTNHVVRRAKEGELDGQFTVNTNAAEDGANIITDIVKEGLNVLIENAEKHLNDLLNEKTSGFVTADALKEAFDTVREDLKQALTELKDKISSLETPPEKIAKVN